MLKGKLALAAFVLSVGIAAAPGAFAAGVGGPNEGLATVGGNFEPVRFCPITIACRKYTHPKCHYSSSRHKCVCHCVPNHPK
jgi:hypothetical protein